MSALLMEAPGLHVSSLIDSAARALGVGRLEIMSIISGFDCPENRVYDDQAPYFEIGVRLRERFQPTDILTHRRSES